MREPDLKTEGKDTGRRPWDPKIDKPDKDIYSNVMRFQRHGSRKRELAERQGRKRAVETTRRKRTQL